MVAFLLFLILLVIAWPIFLGLGLSLLVFLPYILLVLVLAAVYIAVLAAIGRRYNIAPGGKPVDPAFPMGEKLPRPEPKVISPESPVEAAPEPVKPAAPSPASIRIEPVVPVPSPKQA